MIAPTLDAAPQGPKKSPSQKNAFRSADRIVWNSPRGHARTVLVPSSRDSMTASTPNQDQCNKVSKKPKIESKVHVDIDQHQHSWHERPHYESSQVRQMRTGHLVHKECIQQRESREEERKEQEPEWDRMHRDRPPSYSIKNTALRRDNNYSVARKTRFSASFQLRQRQHIPFYLEVEIHRAGIWHFDPECRVTCRV